MTSLIGLRLPTRDCSTLDWHQTSRRQPLHSNHGSQCQCRAKPGENLLHQSSVESKGCQREASKEGSVMGGGSAMRMTTTTTTMAVVLLELLLLANGSVALTSFLHGLPLRSDHHLQYHKPMPCGSDATHRGAPSTFLTTASSDGCIRRHQHLEPLFRPRRHQYLHHGKKTTTSRWMIPSHHCCSVATTASCWTASAVLGHLVEERCLPDSGILVTMATSALLSRLVVWMVPGMQSGAASDILSSFCWNTLLPASLALLLLSLNDDQKRLEPTHENDNNKTAMSVSQSIQQLSIPFALACLGSILGCMVAFGLCLSPLRFLQTNTLLSSSWLLAPQEAQIALSCLAASFVGGSVNFFATANAIQKTMSTVHSVSSATTTSTIVSSMAATDILVMAIYFALIGSALSSTRLKRWFERPGEQSMGHQQPKRSVASNTFAAVEESDHGSIQTRPLWQSFRGAGIASLVTWGMVSFANSVESKLSNVVPGLACAVIASCTPIMKQWLQKLETNFKGSWYQDMGRASSFLSKLCFLMLFSAIGSTADLHSAVRSGPSCLILSLVALLVHFATTFAGSLLVSKSFQKKTSSFFRIDLESILVASNAAIGGPSTAAAFCGRIKGRPSVQGITYAATIFGIVGYAFGTTIGVLLYRWFGFAAGF